MRNPLKINAKCLTPEFLKARCNQNLYRVFCKDMSLEYYNQG
jgi:hypothetical protein